jgi:hypothetical protein
MPATAAQRMQPMASQLPVDYGRKTLGSRYEAVRAVSGYHELRPFFAR